MKNTIDSLFDPSRFTLEEERSAIEVSSKVADIILALIEERVKKGLTQQQLADKCGMKQSAIARMESIESIPRLDTIIRVATALEMTMDLQTSKTVSLANAIPLDSYRNLSYTDNAFQLQGEGYKIDPKLTRDVTITEDGKGIVELILEINNTEEKPFPLDIRISLSGIFDISSIPDESRSDLLNITAVQILFPYLRSILSTVTSGALYPPIILPIIDVRKLFSE